MQDKDRMTHEAVVGTLRKVPEGPPIDYYVALARAAEDHGYAVALREQVLVELLAEVAALLERGLNIDDSKLSGAYWRYFYDHEEN